MPASKRQIYQHVTFYGIALFVASLFLTTNVLLATAEFGGKRLTGDLSPQFVGNAAFPSLDTVQGASLLH